MQSHWTLKPHSENGWNNLWIDVSPKLMSRLDNSSSECFSDFLFNQHVYPTWNMNVSLRSFMNLSPDSDLYNFHRPRTFSWNSHSCWSFFFRCAIEQKFEITPRDIVQRTGVCRAHQSRHRFLFLGGKKICFKKQLRKWKIPGIQWRWTYFFMDLQETHKDHQMLTWKCLIKPSLHLIGGVLSPIISKHMCGSTALRS